MAQNGFPSRKGSKHGWQDVGNWKQAKVSAWHSYRGKGQIHTLQAFTLQLLKERHCPIWIQTFMLHSEPIFWFLVRGYPGSWQNPDEELLWCYPTKSQSGLHTHSTPETESWNWFQDIYLTLHLHLQDKPSPHSIDCKCDQPPHSFLSTHLTQLCWSLEYLTSSHTALEGFLQFLVTANKSL